MSSYPHNKQQYVGPNGYNVTPSGVPQGSNLGSMIFHKVSNTIFVDDFKFYNYDNASDNTNGYYRESLY